MTDRLNRKQTPVLVRFTDPDGVQWTVWDVTWSNKKHNRRPHGDVTATERVFVNAEGVKRAYKLEPNESRVFEGQALERQLKVAKSHEAWAEPFQPGRRGGRGDERHVVRLASDSAWPFTGGSRSQQS